MTRLPRPVVRLVLYAAVTYVIVAGVLLRAVRVFNELIEVRKPL